jgi:hypothetical protein
MATLDISSNELSAIGYYKVMPKFLMFPRKGWHIRLDQKPIGQKGVLAEPLVNAQGNQSGWGYRISSFHIKRDNNSSFVSTTEGAYLGKKIVVEDSKYVYFACAGGGVWQPIWGYGKLEQKHKGESIWKPDNAEIDSDTWGFACSKARWFLEQMTKALGGGRDQGLAMGPIQGAQARLFTQL